MLVTKALRSFSQMKPREELADIPLPPRHPPRDSIFTKEGSPKPEKPETLAQQRQAAYHYTR